MVSEGELINLQNAPLQYIELSAMPAAEKFTLKKRLKTQLAHVRSTIKSIGGEFGRTLAQELPSIVEDRLISGKTCSSDSNQASMGRKRKSPEMSKQQKDADNFPDDEEVFVTEKCDAASTVTSSFKGDTHGRLDRQNRKDLKMDVSKIKQCAVILKKLMTHKSGWVFNHPVDPVKLNLPDYFSIISKPMDLGTIKHKLERKLYSSTHQFAADVRLTFSNAMRYNPPGNFVHIMAEDLNNIFDSKWKPLELKWKKECSKASQQSVRKITQKQTVTSKPVLQRAPSCNSNSLSSKFLTSADKLKLQKDLAKISKKNMPPRLLKFLQKACLLGQSEDRIEVDIDILDVETLWELHQIVRSCGDAGPTESAGVMKNRSQGLRDLVKGSGGTRLKSFRVNDKAHTSPSACENSNCPCGSTDCHCSRHNDFTQASSSDVDSERSSGSENFASHSFASNLDCKKTIVGVHRGYRSSDSSGGQGPAIVDGDNAQPSSHPCSPAATSRKEDDLPCEEQLSPTKALRAAMLKSRFADTILKAQHKTLLNHGEKGDPARMQREREKLEKKQQEEKARIEAQVKAAEAAARMEAEAKLKMQREREREAARLALQKMEKTVDIDENSQILKDLENLGYSQPVHLDMPDEMVVNYMDGVELQSGLMNPLEQLGLFIKDDDLDEEVDDWISAAGNGDVEEGEIGSS